jgi:ABC-type transporter Mla subunit MlaD
MNVLDILLKACMQTDKSPKQRPCIFSVSGESGSTNSLLAQMEKKFDDLVQTVAEIPASLEETFGDIIQNVTDISETLEETFGEIVDALNEYVNPN